MRSDDQVCAHDSSRYHRRAAIPRTRRSRGGSCGLSRAVGDRRAETNGAVDKQRQPATPEVDCLARHRRRFVTACFCTMSVRRLCNGKSLARLSVFGNKGWKAAEPGGSRFGGRRRSCSLEPRIYTKRTRDEKRGSVNQPKATWISSAAYLNLWRRMGGLENARSAARYCFSVASIAADTGMITFSGVKPSRSSR
jgi:hypothetical protein